MKKKKKKKVSIVVHMEVDLPDGDNAAAAAIAKQKLNAALPSAFKTEFNFQLPKDRKRKDRKKLPLKILGTFDLEEVFSKMEYGSRAEFKIGDQSYYVRMNSNRYLVFQHSRFCVSCGLEGVKFVLEQHPNDTSPHFNLYGIENGNMILMTKDHIFAKSCGGGEHHSNFQTMCSVCNNLKGANHITIAGMRELRMLYDKNKNVLSKRQWNLVLKEVIHRLSVPPPDALKYDDALRLKFDINIYGFGNSLIAKTIGEPAPKPIVSENFDWEHLGCMKKGTELKPLEIKAKRLVLFFDERTFEIHQGLTNYSEVALQTQNPVV